MTVVWKIMGFPGGSRQRICLPVQETQETQVQSLGQEDSLQKEMATRSSNSCLENLLDRGAWWATVHGIEKSWTWLSDWACTPQYLHWVKMDLCWLNELMDHIIDVIANTLKHSFRAYGCPHWGNSLNSRWHGRPTTTRNDQKFWNSTVVSQWVVIRKFTVLYYMCRPLWTQVRGRKQIQDSHK